MHENSLMAFIKFWIKSFNHTPEELLDVLLFFQSLDFTLDALLTHNCFCCL